MKIREMQKVQLNHSTSVNGGGGIHPFDELLSILSGSARLNWMGKTYEAQAPALFLLPANTPHSLLVLTRDCEFGYMELEGGYAEAFHVSHARTWNELQTEETALERDPDMATIRGVHQQMWDGYPCEGRFGEITRELMIWDVHKLLTMILWYVHGMEKRKMQAEGKQLWATDLKEQLLPVIRYMESSYQQPLVVRELAEQAHMELNHFIRTFKKFTGKPPLQYLQELRLHAACSYLRTTDMPVQEIARASGFPNLHYFSKLFKKRYDRSPSAYREQRLRE